MYHAHFGLEKGLFGDGIATDAAVFRSPKHDAVAANFKLALGSQSSGVVLRGPAGVGKSTLTSAVLRASSTRLALAWINATPANAAELLELVLVELGVNTVGTTRIERLQLWRQFQAETRATESRLFVVVERTEDLPTDVLHALDSLTAADAVGNLGANFVLLGHGAIEQHLAAPVLESLRQRIRLRAELVPFTEAELQDYLRHQVACAGGHFDHVFAPGTVATLHRLSGGVARLANNLCETALDVAASQQQKLLTPDLVTKTAQSVLGLVEAVQARPAEPAVVRQPPVVTAPVATFVALPPPAVEPPVLKVLLATAPVAAPVTAPVAASVIAPMTPAPAPMAASAPATPTPRILLAATTPLAAAPSGPPPPAVAAAAAPAAAANSAVPPAPPAAPTVAAPPKREREFEFDGGATDISDVALADFPVLTDAVEEPIVAPPKRAAAPPPIEPVAAAPRAPAPQPAAVARAPAAPAAAKPAAPPMSRVETAYAAPKAAPKPAPVATPPAAPAAPAAKATAPPAPLRSPGVDTDDDDLLRQTQTMRAISAAKSIDDISSSMAETLFGDAELDLVTAALASAAAEWPEDQEEPAKATAQPAPSKPQPQKAATSTEDPFDFLGLGDDAPLELMDDATLPPINPTARSAAR
jgi:type II secretory pathway predicted ATPase ExeA